MLMYAVGKFFSQLYYNDCERIILKKLKKPKTRRQVRVRAPFNITCPNLVDISDGTEFQSNARINIYNYLVSSEEEPHLTIGKRCYLGQRESFLVGADITLGNEVIVADDVTFVSYNHGTNPELSVPYMNQNLENVKPITVGDNCWIGEKTTILPGVNIGKGCVIGAMSVVTKDIPDYSMAVGVPAKIIKRYDFVSHEWKSV